MVALPCSIVAARSASMLARAVWMGVLLTGLAHAQTHGRSRFSGDVNDDDVMIDKLNDLLASNPNTLLHHRLPPSPVRPQHNQQNVNRKIDFAVTPQDERYYLPPSPSIHNPVHSELLRYQGPDDGFRPQLDYPGDALQYQDEDSQYPQEYAGGQQGEQYRFPYLSEELQRRPNYLTKQELRYFSRLYPKGLQDQELLRGNDEDLEAGLRDRIEDVGGSLDDGLNGDVSQMIMKKGKEAKETEAEMMDDAAKEGEKKNEDRDVTGGSESSKTSSKATATSQPETLYYSHLRHEPAIALHKAPLPGSHHGSELSDIYFTGLLAGCTAIAVCAVVGAGICWYKLNKSHRAAQDAEYPAYGVTGPNKDLSPSGDRKLAQSAHMYHYQHQKQQMIALEKPSGGGERHGSASDVDSEEDGEENEYTVYECPGLAPTGEMEVKNPLFHDDPTPATPSIRKANDQDHDCHEQEK